MEVYRFQVQNLKFKEAIEQIVRELKKIYAVRLVEVSLEDSQVKVIMEEIGSIFAIKSVLKKLGFPVKQMIF